MSVFTFALTTVLHILLVTCAEDEYFTKISQAYNQNKECLAEVVISGKGLKDTFTVPCVQDGMKYISSGKVLVVGNPEKDSFGLYSGSPSTLIIFGEVCKMRKYTISSGTTRITDRDLTPSDCDRMKNSAKKEFKNAKNTIHNVAMPPVPKEDEPLQLEKSPTKQDAKTTGGPIRLETKITLCVDCLHHIAVKGNGIEDKFTTRCNTVGISGYTTDKLLIFGNPSYNSFVLYSDEPATLYVIKDKVCEKRSYVGTEISTTSEDCERLKERVAKKIKAEKKNMKGSSHQRYLINKVKRLLEAILKNSIH